MYAVLPWNGEEVVVHSHRVEYLLQVGPGVVAVHLASGLHLRVGGTPRVVAKQIWGPIPRWVPATERSPAESGRYFVTVEDSGGVSTTYLPWEKEGCRWVSTGVQRIVLAWLEAEPWQP